MLSTPVVVAASAPTGGRVAAAVGVAQKRLLTDGRVPEAGRVAAKRLNARGRVPVAGRVAI